MQDGVVRVFTFYALAWHPSKRTASPSMATTFVKRTDDRNWLSTATDNNIVFFLEQFYTF